MFLGEDAHEPEHAGAIVKALPFPLVYGNGEVLRNSAVARGPAYAVQLGDPLPLQLKVCNHENSMRPIGRGWLTQIKEEPSGIGP